MSKKSGTRVQLGNFSQVKMAGMKFFKKGVVSIRFFQTGVLTEKFNANLDSNCTVSVPWLYPKSYLRYAETVPWLYPQCTLTVPTVYPRCAAVNKVKISTNLTEENNGFPTWEGAFSGVGSPRWGWSSSPKRDRLQLGCVNSTQT